MNVTRLQRAAALSGATVDMIKLAVTDLLLVEDILPAIAAPSMASVYGPSFTAGFDEGVFVERERICINAGLSNEQE